MRENSPNHLVRAAPRADGLQTRPIEQPHARTALESLSQNSYGTGFQPFNTQLQIFPGASPQADIERALGASNSLFELDLSAVSAM